MATVHDQSEKISIQLHFHCEMLVKHEKTGFLCKEKCDKVFCSAGIVRWRGDADRSRMEKHE